MLNCDTPLANVMMDRSRISEIISHYDKNKLKLGAIASHSALDLFDGAVEEGFRTVAICMNGREETYAKYFKCKRDAKGNALRGIVDEATVLSDFSELMKNENIARLKKENVILVPNRALTSYVSIDEVENALDVPMLGSRNLLRTEERGEERDYYWLLQKAGLPFPERIPTPKEINELSIVKLHHAKKKLERGFFTAASYDEYKQKSEKLLKDGVITKGDLASARIERYIIGPIFNLDFFYSPIEKEMSPLELLGVDWRFETSLDGHVRLPAEQQLALTGKQRIPEYTVCGHNSSTIRESLLEKAFRLGEKYVASTQEHYAPGIIGAFCLQTAIDKDLNFYIYDVAPRVGGGTNVHMALGHPYGNALWRTNMSTGRRTALEVRRAIEMDKLADVLT